MVNPKPIFTIAHNLEKYSLIRKTLPSVMILEAGRTFELVIHFDLGTCNACLV